MKLIFPFFIIILSYSLVKGNKRKLASNNYKELMIVLFNHLQIDYSVTNNHKFELYFKKIRDFNIYEKLNLTASVQYPDTSKDIDSVAIKCSLYQLMIVDIRDFEYECVLFMQLIHNIQQ